MYLLEFLDALRLITQRCWQVNDKNILKDTHLECLMINLVKYVLFKTAGTMSRCTFCYSKKWFSGSSDPQKRAIPARTAALKCQSDQKNRLFDGWSKAENNMKSSISGVRTMNWTAENIKPAVINDGTPTYFTLCHVRWEEWPFDTTTDPAVFRQGCLLQWHRDSECSFLWTSLRKFLAKYKHWPSNIFLGDGREG